MGALALVRATVFPSRPGSAFPVGSYIIVSRESFARQSLAVHAPILHRGHIVVPSSKRMKLCGHLSLFIGARFTTASSRFGFALATDRRSIGVCSIISSRTGCASAIGCTSLFLRGRPCARSLFHPVFLHFGHVRGIHFSPHRSHVHCSTCVCSIIFITSRKSTHHTIYFYRW
jgi:hypothetical protein